MIKVYSEWQDFVVYTDEDRVRSLRDRLDISTALDAENPNRHYPFDLIMEHGVICQKEIHVTKSTGAFEAMGIDDAGNVCIWCEHYVLVLARGIGPYAGERLLHVRRHPTSLEPSFAVPPILANCDY